MSEIQGELFDTVPEITFEDLPEVVCPICKGTGYTKGTRCVCSED